MIAAAQTIAKRLGVDTLRRQEFARESGFSLEHVYKLFPDGGWRAFLEAAQKGSLKNRAVVGGSLAANRAALADAALGTHPGCARLVNSQPRVGSAATGQDQIRGRECLR